MKPELATPPSFAALARLRRVRSALARAARRAAREGSNVLIVLDSSGSMAGKVGGQAKMDSPNAWWPTSSRTCPPT